MTQTYGGYPGHPAAALCPLLADDSAEFLALVESIRYLGLLDPVVLLDGQILDGRNRARACAAAGVPLRTVEWEGSPGGSPTAWALARNVERRHLTPSQRAAIALDALPLFEAEAAERRTRRAATRGGEEPSILSGPRGPHARTKGNPAPDRARDRAAQAAGTSGRSVDRARDVAATAPDLMPAVRAGSLPLGRAAAVARLPVQQRAAVLAAVERGEKPAAAAKAAAAPPALADAAGTPVPPALAAAWTATATAARETEQALRAAVRAWATSRAELEAAARALGRPTVRRDGYDIVDAFVAGPAKTLLGAVRQMVPHAVCSACHGSGCDTCHGIGWMGPNDAKNEGERRATRAKMRARGVLP